MNKLMRWLENSNSRNQQTSKNWLESHLIGLQDFTKTFLGSDRQFLQQPQSAKKIFSILLVASTTPLLLNCSYKSPGVEEPVPVESDIDKSFFFKSEVDSKTKKTLTVPRKFLCGWASEMEVGERATWFYTNNAIATEHCNLVFEITESQLIGKLINPSFPNDPSRWEGVLAIPITSHHYQEKEKDSAGRETQKVIRNTSRSHWSARPKMIVDLERISLNGKFKPYEGYFGLTTNLKVSKIEWDTKNGFLGFSMEKETGNGSYARVRFNIKEFETNPKFVSTPFNDKNYKHMNLLHIMGEKVNGIHPILKAAHWDVSKKIEIRLWQVPDKYRDLMIEVVNDWNEVFRKTEATTLTEGPFVVSPTPAQHAFDLRYPTIAWVSDDRISQYSPLGIGMTLADVSNGEVKWGMITLYAGLLEQIMKSYVETNSSGSVSAQVSRLAKSLSQFIKKPSMIKEIDFAQWLQTANVSDRLVTQFDSTANLNGLIPDRVKSATSATANKSTEPRVDTNAPIAAYLQSKNFLQGLLSKNQMLAQNIQMSAQQSFSGKSPTDLIKSEFLNKKLSSLHENSEESQEKPPTDLASFRESLRKKYSGPTFCQDRRIIDVMPSFAAALNETNSSGAKVVNEQQVLRSFIKELTSHEFGHFLGLGHQFKENILPEKDSVPESIYQELAKKATEENRYTNYTSVMGYRSARVELAEKSNVLPGPQDHLAIRFLYKKQYATFKKGDSQFTFFNVPADGIIPPHNPENPEFKTSYFPQCNDIDASYGFDPFCNRWDAGHNATTIVKNYFDELRLTLPQTLVAFTDSRGDAQEAEGRLWMRSLDTLSRVRTFYDYMRVYYKEQFDQIRNNEEALMNFSQACKEPKVEDIKVPVLRKIFSEKPALADLCRANGLALQKMKEIVQSKGRDYTNVDITNQISPGGLSGGDAERDYSRILGTWKELSVFPLKYSSLMALTEPSPWVMVGGWMLPNFLYSNPQTLFSYMYIYPREYTDVLASNIKSNLQFAGVDGAEKTALGRSILSMLWMNWIANNENRDAGLFPEEYKNKIRRQQQFNVGLVAIIMKGAAREGGQVDRIVRWNGEVYDFVADKSIPLNTAYLLPKGKIIATASNMIMFPVSDFTPYSATEGYAFAYKLEINQENQPDGLSDLSAKKDLADHADKLLNACLNGQDNGLKNFFNVENLEFEGFEMGQNLERVDEKRKRFLDSIDAAFSLYLSNKSLKTQKAFFAVPPREDACMESLRGLGLLINTGAIMNGYVLPQIFDYIQ
jgi:hypothetical protein